jgi:hypothetical protein
VFLVGYAFLAAVGFIPVLGSIVGWLAVVLGLGGLTAFLAKTPAVAPAAPQPLAVPPVPAPPVESTSAPMPIKVEVAGTVKRVKKVTTVRRARKPAVKKARPAVRKRSRR